MPCAIWYQILLGACMINDRSKACKCMLTLFSFYLHGIYIHLNELTWRSNGSVNFQKLEFQTNRLGA